MIYSSILESYMIEHGADCNINISPMQIQALSEACFDLNPVFITEAIINKENRKAADAMKKQLEKNNLGDCGDEVVAKASHTSNQVAGIIKRKGLNRDVFKEISVCIDNFTSSITELFMDRYILNFPKAYIGKYDVNNIVNAVVLLLTVAAIELVIMWIVSLLFGPVVANVVVNGIIIPIATAITNQIAIKGKFVAEYTIISSTISFGAAAGSALAANKLTNGMIKATGIIKHAAINVGVSIVTTIAQWAASSTKIMNAIGLDPKKDKEKCTTIGMAIGVFSNMIFTFCYGFNPNVAKKVIDDTIDISAPFKSFDTAFDNMNTAFNNMNTDFDFNF